MLLAQSLQPVEEPGLVAAGVAAAVGLGCKPAFQLIEETSFAAAAGIYDRAAVPAPWARGGDNRRIAEAASLHNPPGWSDVAADRQSR